MGEEFYRQCVPPLGLSVERATNLTPEPQKYYVLKDGQILGSFSTLKAAQTLYKQIILESGYKPASPNESTKTASELATERYLEAKEFYWADSYNHRGGGGRGGRGGV